MTTLPKRLNSDAQLEIPVSDLMIEAGLEAFREHHYDSDVRYMLECVFRAMAYEGLHACSITRPR